MNNNNLTEEQIVLNDITTIIENVINATGFECLSLGTYEGTIHAVYDILERAGYIKR